MATYIILSRVSPEVLENLEDFKQLAEKVSAKVKTECPDVIWKQSYVTLGRFDVVDIVESDDPGQIARVSVILRTTGRETTDIDGYSLERVPRQSVTGRLFSLLL